MNVESNYASHSWRHRWEFYECKKEENSTWKWSWNQIFTFNLSFSTRAHFSSGCHRFSLNMNKWTLGGCAAHIDSNSALGTNIIFFIMRLKSHRVEFWVWNSIMLISWAIFERYFPILLDYLTTNITTFYHSIEYFEHTTGNWQAKIRLNFICRVAASSSIQYSRPAIATWIVISTLCELALLVISHFPSPPTSSLDNVIIVLEREKREKKKHSSLPSIFLFKLISSSSCSLLRSRPRPPPSSE